MSVNFTLDDVVAKIREVAAERPDYVYDNGTSGRVSLCYYRHGDEPGCIVGHALDRLGWVVSSEGGSSTDVLADLLDFDRFGEAAKDPRVVWIRKVQHEQDYGTPWGPAVERADAEALAAAK